MLSRPAALLLVAACCGMIPCAWGWAGGTQLTHASKAQNKAGSTNFKERQVQTSLRMSSSPHETQQLFSAAPLRVAGLMAGAILVCGWDGVAASAQTGFASSVPSDGYELAPIVKDGKPSPVLLVPVVKALNALENMQPALASGSMDQWKAADIVLSQKPFAPSKELKRVLNAYSDNIYTTDTSRRNKYLDGAAMLGQGQSTFGFGTLSVGAGGASPLTGETMTYLYRNQALENVDALQAELKYLIKQRKAGKEEDTADLFKYLQVSQDSLNKYLSGLNQEDVQLAKNYVAKGAK
mmetsp:Transcript_16490/g.32561  ORF Transcript_16490/g.32561 Transcript_16490/m.32561 type:complete len:295 (+) Transcript_16490:182-1066(+)